MTMTLALNVCHSTSCIWETVLPVTLPTAYYAQATTFAPYATLTQQQSWFWTLSNPNAWSAVQMPTVFHAQIHSPAIPVPQGTQPALVHATSVRSQTVFPAQALTSAQSVRTPQGWRCTQAPAEVLVYSVMWAGVHLVALTITVGLVWPDIRCTRAGVLCVMWPTVYSAVVIMSATCVVLQVALLSTPATVRQHVWPVTCQHTVWLAHQTITVRPAIAQWCYTRATVSPVT